MYVFKALLDNFFRSLFYKSIFNNIHFRKIIAQNRLENKNLCNQLKNIFITKT